MNNQTVEEATYELRKITEQLDDNRRAFTEHYRKKEDVATIFQEVTNSFHEDKEIWKEGEMRYTSESIFDEVSSCQSKFWNQYEEDLDELERENSYLYQKETDLMAEKKELLKKETTK
ncbi:DUF3958 family protein [Carnobacterium gallinarum]|uniref:DUF3958 family protein n=1 Tax=Carnobacterium gallinarum TaxID=2749 RepID=UPI000552920D|nr:DUF3958 family protein [Carnobacterium gallinarum]